MGIYEGGGGDGMESFVALMMMDAFYVVLYLDEWGKFNGFGSTVDVAV
jgi:hypothetical protein